MRHNNSEKKEKMTAAALQRGTHMLLDMVISIYILIIIGALPFYNREGYAHIGTDKYAFFSNIVRIILWPLAPLLFLYLVFGLISAIQQKRTAAALWAAVREKISVTDVCAAAYGVSVLLSYHYSYYREEALRGATGWFMGLYTQLTLVATYFVVSKCWKPKKGVFYTILPVSAAVFLLGFLNRFEINPLHMVSYGPDFISTIGNINWYCGYLVSVFFAGAALFWQTGKQKKWIQIALAVYLVIGFASLITQGSNSGIVALAAELFVLFCLSVSDGARMCRFWQILCLLGAACLLTFGIKTYAGLSINYEDIFVELFSSGSVALSLTIVSFFGFAVTLICVKSNHYSVKLWRILAGLCSVIIVTVMSGYVAALIVNTRYPGSVGTLSENSWFIFSNTWGSNRGASWKAGVMCFLDQNLLHKLFGVGPDAMSAYIYSRGSRPLLDMLSETFDNLRLTNAHNEWLTILVNTGIAGLLSYAGMMVSAMIRFLKTRSSRLISCACGFCLLGYTVNNMFSFQQALNVATIFTVLGMGEAFLRESASN